MDGLSDKVYVSVDVYFSPDGAMYPRALVWEDGIRYGIDRVIDVRPAAAAKAGGLGDRYTVAVGGKRRYIYFERSANVSGNVIGRWFVERR